jgi:Fur family transcriptional regulator, ferric uptake regulator
MTPPGHPDDLHALIESRLRRVEQRYTGGRRAIIDLMLEESHPISIADIGAALPSLPRSSAYRHLVDLQAAGVVRRIAATDEFARFELDEHLTEHHHHLICTGCGRVLDITPSAGFERTVSRQLGELAAAHGFTPAGHVVDVLGTCADCA